MTKTVCASRDATLSARVVRRWSLFYSAGADTGLDRPAHVRAGSALTLFRGRLAVIQDDANFVAFIDTESGTVDSIPLPDIARGTRQFDDLRGNRLEKLDLESCTTIVDDGHEVLLAIGSGSSPCREQILSVTWPAASEPDIRLCHVPTFYNSLRTCTDFAGSELNIEGAVYLGGDTIRLFQRGNGAPREGLGPVNATCDISWRMLRAHLNNSASVVLGPENVAQFELGLLDGVRLTFTDAAVRGPSLFFTATAEASPDAVHDGPVMGSVLGQIHADGTARWAILQDPDGRRMADKVEGLCLDPTDSTRGWITIDRDDPSAPSELCEVELLGDWEAG